MMCLFSFFYITLAQASDVLESILVGSLHLAINGMLSAGCYTIDNLAVIRPTCYIGMFCLGATG